MRISDWSSDVCSSDLHLDRLVVDDIAAGIEQSVLPVAGIGVERDVGQDADIIAARILDRRHRAAHQIEIGRASCMERVCQYVLISVVAASLNKKTLNNVLKKHQL